MKGGRAHAASMMLFKRMLISTHSGQSENDAVGFQDFFSAEMLKWAFIYAGVCFFIH